MRLFRWLIMLTLFKCNVKLLLLLLSVMSAVLLTSNRAVDHAAPKAISSDLRHVVIKVTQTQTLTPSLNMSDTLKD